MRLSISNIAWDRNEDESVASLLKQFSVDAIDIAPGKYFPEPTAAQDQDITDIKQYWSDHGIEITGMQALLFGTQGLNLFGNFEVQNKMLKHLQSVCRIGAGLNANRLVFGSPKNRDRSGLSDELTIETAVQFFTKLAEIAKSFGVIICLEPNPPCYGSNFMTNTADTAQIVKLVSHPSIKMQFDAGAITINNEDSLATLHEFSSLIGHVHLSEPDLLPLGDGTTDHAKTFTALHKYLPSHVAAIEMLASKNESHLTSIKRALKVADSHYRAKASAK